MDADVLPKGELRVADGSVPTGAPFLAVDADGVGPSGFTDGSFDVKDISTLARALEINEMECFVLIDGCLRLYAPICGAEKLDLALRSVSASGVPRAGWTRKSDRSKTFFMDGPRKTACYLRFVPWQRRGL